MLVLLLFASKRSRAGWEGGAPSASGGATFYFAIQDAAPATTHFYGGVYKTNGAVTIGSVSALFTQADACTNAIVSIQDCGTTAGTCSTPTTIGNVTFSTSQVTTPATQIAGTVVSPSVAAGHYITAHLTTLGSCTGITGSVTAVATSGAGAQGPAGNTGGLRFNFNNTATSGDPGSGNLLYNNSAIASVTAINISYTDQNSVNQSAFEATWSSSSTTVNRGQLLVQSAAQTGGSDVFQVNGAVVDHSTYKTVPVAYLSGSLPTNSQPLSLIFTRSGDSGNASAPATNNLLKGDNAGGMLTAIPGTDYWAPGNAITASSFQSSATNNSTTGIYNAPNNTQIFAARNGANSADVPVTNVTSDNVVHFGGANAAGLSFDNSASVSQGTFTSGAFLNAPVVNNSFSGGTESCAQDTHVVTLSANSTITLSCSSTSITTLNYFIAQPASGSVYTYAFAAANGAALLGDTPTACGSNGCIDQVRVTWVPSLNDYFVNLVKANIGGVGTCPSGQACYYVAATGSDTNTGTDTSHPFKTLGKAETILSSLNPGDELLFRGGDTWVGDGTASTCGSNCNPSFLLGDTAAHAVTGTAAKNVVISTYGTGRAIIDGNNLNGWCIAAIGPGFNVKYVTISNFECKNAFAQGIYLHSSIAGFLVGNTLSNNYVHNTGPGCAMVNGACNSSPPQWSAISYAVGSLINPGTNNSPDFTLINQNACTASGTQPNWGSIGLGSTISDAGCTWTAVQQGSGTGPWDAWVGWALNTHYASSGGFGNMGATFIEPIGSTVNPGSFVYRETAASCISSASTQPTFTQTPGQSTTEGSGTGPCVWLNTGVAGAYMNQFGLEDDGIGADSVKLLNNIIKWGGGHNLLEVHYDNGSALLQGNIVGPGCPHGCLDVKGLGSATTTGQILSNTVTCGFSAGLCGDQASGVGGGTAGYTQNTFTANSTELWALNVFYDSGVGFAMDSFNGNPINMKFYNNTIYASSYGNGFALTFNGAAGTGYGTVDVRNNIFDGGKNHCVSVPGGWSSSTEDYNDIGGSQGCPAFTFNGSTTVGSHDLYCTSSCSGGSADPKYVNASASPLNFTLQAGSPCIGKGLSGLTANNNIGAF